MEFTDFKELKKLMTTGVHEFEFEEDQAEADSYEKGFMHSYQSAWDPNAIRNPNGNSYQTYEPKDLKNKNQQ